MEPETFSLALDAPGGATFLLRRTGQVELVMVVGRWSSITTRLYLRLDQALVVRIDAMMPDRTRELVEVLVRESRALFSRTPWPNNGNNYHHLRFIVFIGLDIRGVHLRVL